MFGLILFCHDLQVQLQASRVHGRHSSDFAGSTSDKAHQDTLHSLHQGSQPSAVYTNDIADLEEGGWSSGFDDSDDDMIGGPF